LLLFALVLPLPGQSGAVIVRFLLMRLCGRIPVAALPQGC